MNRRKLLSTAPAAMVLAGAAAGLAVAAPPRPSPILDAARRLAALNQQHEAADVVGASDVELDRIWRLIWSQEAFILAATPTTVTEAMVVLMVAAGNLDAADPLEDAAGSAAARATRYLAATVGVDVAEFGGDLYLPADATPSCMRSAA